MSRSAHRTLRSTALLLAALTLGAGSAQAAGCDHADRPVRELTTVEVTTALRCLHHAERARHDRPELGPSTELTRLGRAKAQDMAEREYFDHTSPDGQTFHDRMAASRYGDDGYAAGENIGRVTGGLSPHRLVELWLDSPGHRRNLLDPGFRRIGIGVARDARGRILAAVVLGRRW